MEIDKINLELAKGQMHRCLNLASDSGQGTYSDLELAENMLEKSKGIFHTLNTLDLLTEKEKNTTMAGIERIEDALAEIRRQNEIEVFERHRDRM